jgi:carboxylesterase
MKEMANYFHESLNCTIYAPLLAGHGVDVATINQCKWQDWENSAVDAYSELAKNYNTIFVLGMSMGAALTLRLASNHKIKAIVCMGTPYKLSFKTKWASILQYFLGHINDSDGPDIADPEQKKKAVSLRAIPLAALTELTALLKNNRNIFNKVNCPVLFMHSINDHVIDYSNMDIIFNQVSSLIKEKITLHDSFHILPLDKERLTVFAKAKEFILRFVEIEKQH